MEAEVEEAAVGSVHTFLDLRFDSRTAAFAGGGLEATSEDCSILASSDTAGSAEAQGCGCG